LADFHDHALISARLSDDPFVDYQTEASPHSLSALRCFASEANTAEPPKSLTLADRDTRGQAPEIRVQADEDCPMQFAYRSDEGVGGILCNPLTQQNHFMTGVAKGTADRIGDTMINEKSYRERLYHQAAELALS
jgi:hypothetical protein